MKIVKKLTDKGFPKSSKFYKEAHSEADNKERRRYPRAYANMKIVDKRLAKHELAGKNLKSGKIEISSKVPKKDRKDVALHERTENKAIKRMEHKRK